MTCDTCGLDFTQKSNTTGRFCSAKCWYASPRTRTTPLCAQCNAVRCRKQAMRFCSRSCRSAFAITRTAERFWAFVDKSNGPDGCWLWTGAVHRHGYGAFSASRNGRVHHLRAHRVAFELMNGPFAKDLFVCHRCDNPRCVNPAHLFLGTARDNARDRERKGRGPGPLVRGERHGMSKLREEQVIEIRRRTDESPSQLASEFKVSTALIYRIRRRLAWNHLPEVTP